MKNFALIILLAVAVCLPASAQFGTVQNGALSGNCNSSPTLGMDRTTPGLYFCGDTHTWVPVASLTTAQTFTTTVTSATPGTVRAIVGNITTSASTMTSGNPVGVRGANTVPAGTTVSGQTYLYGVQGKLINSGTLNGSAWAAGVMGQIDISAGTLTAAAHVTPLWVDFGATGPAASVAFLDGLVLTNTTATTGNAMFYGYGKFAKFLDLSTNGSAFFAAATGNAAGNCAQTGGVVPANVLIITVNGTALAIPTCVQG